jgi:Kef-type K+ transport system membrane component KefB
MVFVPWLVLKVTRLEKWIPLPMAQIAFGICMGPSALGQFYPDLFSTVFTQPIKTGLDAIQILAITVFAFIAGIELKPKTQIKIAMVVQTIEIIIYHESCKTFSSLLKCIPLRHK